MEITHLSPKQLSDETLVLWGLKYLREYLERHQKSYDVPLLYVAADNGQHDVVRICLDMGMNPNDTINTTTTTTTRTTTTTTTTTTTMNTINKSWCEPRTPLQVAAKRGHVQVAKLLLQRGADPAGSSTGRTALCHALANDHDDVVVALYEAGAISRNHSIPGSPDHEPALTIAIERNNKEMTELLCAVCDGEFPVDHTPPGCISTPLHEAICLGHMEVFQVLLKHRAYIGELSQTRDTPLHVAINEGRQDMVKALVCVEEEDIVSPGVNLDAMNAKGYTPLHQAIVSGQSEIVELLLGRGANVHARVKGSSMGLTCLHLAVLAKNNRIIALLIQYGASKHELAHETSEIGWTLTSLVFTPMELAMREELDPQIAFLKKDHTATDINKSDTVHGTMLHRAVSQQRLCDVQRLLEWGADLDLQAGHHMETPLHIAVKHPNIDMVELLLKYKPRFLRNGMLRSPLDVAVLGRNEKAVAALLSHGAPVDCPQGKVPAVMDLIGIGDNELIVLMILERFETIGCHVDYFDLLDKLLDAKMLRCVYCVLDHVPPHPSPAELVGHGLWGNEFFRRLRSIEQLDAALTAFEKIRCPVVQRTLRTPLGDLAVSVRQNNLKIVVWSTWHGRARLRTPDRPLTTKTKKLYKILQNLIMLPLDIQKRIVG